MPLYTAFLAFTLFPFHYFETDVELCNPAYVVYFHQSVRELFVKTAYEYAGSCYTYRDSTIFSYSLFGLG